MIKNCKVCKFWELESSSWGVCRLTKSDGCIPIEKPDTLALAIDGEMLSAYLKTKSEFYCSQFELKAGYVVKVIYGDRKQQLELHYAVEEKSVGLVISANNRYATVHFGYDEATFDVGDLMIVNKMMLPEFHKGKEIDWWKICERHEVEEIL